MSENANKMSENERLAQLKKLALAVFESNAYTRFMTVFQMNPERAQQALQVCVSRAQRNGSKISDAQLKHILEALASRGARSGSISIQRK
ncbi:MAG: hypothetical protein D6769_03630 [Methanobacteriota archaeon]|nr:MAG: hypothetical protein D6769_03630 [Euryarchaeota archaeon]